LAEKAPQSYVVVLLDTLGGTASEATAISKDGTVVGYSSLPSGSSHAAIWRHFTITDLGTLGGADSIAWAINDRGHAVGKARDAQQVYRPVRWSQGTISDLGTLGGAEGEARSINGSGNVVGSSNVADPPFNAPSHATLWDRQRVVDLGTLGGERSGAYVITGNGVIAGAASTATQPYAQATVWIDGVPRNISAPQHLTSVVYHANSSGLLVGNAADFSGGNYYAVKWVNYIALRLAELEPGRPSFAQAVNSSEEIVGYTDTQSGYIATYWRGDTVIDLNTALPARLKRAGWRLAKALAINDRGWIVGSAFNSQTSELRAFLLKPSRHAPRARD
jgi:probable HAF family extracellular repeat protein